MKFQKVYAEACEKKRAKENIKREAELKLERAKKKEEKQAEKLRRYESYPLSKMYTLLPFLNSGVRTTLVQESWIRIGRNISSNERVPFEF